MGNKAWKSLSPWYILLTLFQFWQVHREEVCRSSDDRQHQSHRHGQHLKCLRWNSASINAIDTNKERPMCIAERGYSCQIPQKPHNESIFWTSYTFYFYEDSNQWHEMISSKFGQAGEPHNATLPGCWAYEEHNWTSGHVSHVSKLVPFEFWSEDMKKKI